MIDESHIAFSEKILEAGSAVATTKTTAYLVITVDRIDTHPTNISNKKTRSLVTKQILSRLYASPLNDLASALQTFSRDPSHALELLNELHTKLTKLIK